MVEKNGPVIRFFCGYGFRGSVGLRAELERKTLNRPRPYAEGAQWGDLTGVHRTAETPRRRSNRQKHGSHKHAFISAHTVRIDCPHNPPLTLTALGWRMETRACENNSRKNPVMALHSTTGASNWPKHGARALAGPVHRWVGAPETTNRGVSSNHRSRTLIPYGAAR